ncbi:hypothetical protein ACFQ3S_17895 [Mucilaginibacter terrae]|uniref:hypothetical protein n=1 Tax=Mucilaginibacter terrae TaxID=1955052 RepID=UPI003643F04B
MKNKNWEAWVNMELPLNTPGGVLQVNGELFVDEKAKYSLIEAVNQPINSKELLLEVSPSAEGGDMETLLHYQKDLMEEGQYKSVRIIGAGKEDILIEDIEIITKDEVAAADNLSPANNTPRKRPKSISYYMGDEFLHEDKFFYNAKNLLERIEGGWDDGLYEYDSFNKLVSFKNENETKSLKYDSKGRFSVIDISRGQEALKSASVHSIISKAIIKKLQSSGKETQERWKFSYSIRGRLARIDIYEVQNNQESFVETLKLDYTISGKLKQLKGSELTMRWTFDDYYNALYNTHAFYILQEFLPIYNNVIKLVETMSGESGEVSFISSFTYKYNSDGFPVEEEFEIKGANGEIPEPAYTKKLLEYENY